MSYVYASVLVFFNTIGLLLIPFGLPGIWLMALGTAGLAWWQWESGMFGLPVLVAVLALAVLAELVELLAALAGAKRAGASRGGSWGGLLGGFLGGIIFTPVIPIPIVGTIVGACLGALAGATAFEIIAGQQVRPALRSGTGAATGRLVGTVAKLGCGVALWILAAVAAFWP